MLDGDERLDFELLSSTSVSELEDVSDKVESDGDLLFLSLMLVGIFHRFSAPLCKKRPDENMPTDSIENNISEFDTWV